MTKEEFEFEQRVNEAKWKLLEKYDRENKRIGWFSLSLAVVVTAWMIWKLLVQTGVL